MSRTTATGLILIAVLTAAAAGLKADPDRDQQASGSTADQPIRCGITATAKGTGTALEAWIEADRDGTGRYRMEITRSGAGGRSSITQSGRFSFDAGRYKRLGSIMLNGPVDRIRSELEIEVDGLRLHCTGTPEATPDSTKEQTGETGVTEL